MRLDEKEITIYKLRQNERRIQISSTCLYFTEDSF
jgi:hypothetical protein